MTTYIVLHNDQPIKSFEFMTLATLYIIQQDKPEEYRIEVRRAVEVTEETGR